MIPIEIVDMLHGQGLVNVEDYSTTGAFSPVVDGGCTTTQSRPRRAPALVL